MVEGSKGITLDPVKNILYVSNGSKTITRINATTFEKLDEFNVHHSEKYEQNGITEL